MARAKKETLISATQHNVLATGTNIKGDIDSEEDFRIDGAIDGNISCRGKIVVGQNGAITGNITSTNIEVFGQVKGNIICKDTLILRSTSKLIGDLKMQVIEIEPGAQIMESTLSMINKGAEAEFAFSEE
ncbi:MAG: polymer-forming cytoskeletal protein [Dysgonomonas sp.]